MTDRNNFFELTEKFKQNIDWLNLVLLGGENDSAFINGIEKPSIDKRFNDRFSELKAMVKGRRAFETLSDLLASGLPPEDTLLAEVWKDPSKINNGLYGWTGSEWEKSPYDDVNELTKHVDSLIEMAESSDVLQAFVDSAGRMYAAFNRLGELEALLSNSAKEAANYLNFVQDEKIAFGITDINDRLVFGVTHSGEVIPSPNLANVKGYAFLVVDPDDKIILGVTDKGELKSFGSEDSAPVIPEVDKNSIAFSLEVGTFPLLPGKIISGYHRALIEPKLSLPCQAVGRSTDPVLNLTDNGFCHPKVVYKPGGWNGFQYWMLMTPYFGVVGLHSQYENPTILCSNDGVKWKEPDGLVNPIDVPNDEDSSYWSDTHLVLGDDGFLYAFYRGNHFGGGNRLYAYKRSRDGVNWSDREVIFHTDTSSADTSNRTLSPSWYKHGDGVWACIDVLWPSPQAVNWPYEVENQSQVFKRTSPVLSGKMDATGYGEYDPKTQIINYLNRDEFKGLTPWHIDEVKIGALHLQLINTGYIGNDSGRGLQLAWSVDGWNYHLLPAFDISGEAYYRSCLVPISITDNSITLLAYIGTVDGNVALEEITLEIN
ncbi:hypothetical protein D5E71_15150 [Vibrio parahaemolyticus]|nr:hypothetical protein D5E71_15150 [Vibrio parahaemolyticus]